MLDMLGKLRSTGRLCGCEQSTGEMEKYKAAYRSLWSVDDNNVETRRDAGRV